MHFVSVFAELNEAMRQRVDTKFIKLLNKIQIRHVDEDVQKQIRERFIGESDINYLENALHMFAEKHPTVKDNRRILDKLSGKTYKTRAIDHILADCKYPETLI